MDSDAASRSVFAGTVFLLSFLSLAAVTLVAGERSTTERLQTRGDTAVSASRNEVGSVRRAPATRVTSRAQTAGNDQVEARDVARTASESIGVLVRDENGEPVAEARVAVYWVRDLMNPDDRWREALRTWTAPAPDATERSGADGVAWFPWREEYTSGWLVATAESPRVAAFPSPSKLAASLAGSILTVAASPPTDVFALLESPDGAVPSDVRASLRPVRPNSGAAQVVGIRRGTREGNDTLRFSGVPAGEYELIVHRGASVIAGMLRFRVPCPRLLKVRLSASEWDVEAADTTIRGRLVGPSNENLAGRRVLAISTTWEAAMATATTDAWGRYELTCVPEGPYVVVLDGVGGGYDSGLITSLPVMAGAEDVPIAVPRGFTLSGSLHTPDGRAVIGLRLSVERTKGANGSPDPVGGTVMQCRTGTSGEFCVRELPRGEYRLRPIGCDSSGAPWSVPDSVIVSGNTYDVVLAARPARVLRGRVLSRDGDPIDRVIVNAQSQTTESVASATTDPEGGFQFVGLDEGDRFELSVRIAGRCAVLSSVRAGDPDVVLRLEEALVGISGLLIDDDDEPIRSRGVRVLQADEPDPAAVFRTDGEGRFEVLGLTPGASYRFEVWVPAGDGSRHRFVSSPIRAEATGVRVVVVPVE